MSNTVEKRVNVSIELTMTDVKGPMASSNIKLSDIPYAGAVAIEKKYLELQQMLYTWGVANASGQEPKIDL